MSISQNLSSIRPTLNLNFARSKTLDPRITFTRSGSATYIDKNGSLRTVAANVPRFGYNTVTGESLGLLLEPSITNTSTYSSNFDNTSVWSYSSSFVMPNSHLAPDNTYTAYLYRENGANGHRVQRNYSAVNGTTYTFSCFFKNVSRRYAYIGSSNFNNFGATFDLVSGTTVAPAGTISTITQLSNSWYRCSITFTANTTVTSTAMFGSNNSNSGNNSSYVLDGNTDLYIWGAQIEVGNSLTSYIPTPATFTSRASSATFYDSTGTLRTAATNVARSDAYFPDNLNVFQYGGLVLENAATNSATYSERFENSAWTKIGTTIITPNTTLAPDNTLTASTITMPSIGDWVWQGTSAATGVQLTLSVFLAGTGTIYIVTYDNVSGSQQKLITLTPTLTRHSFTFSFGAGSTDKRISIANRLNNGNTTTTVIAWGAQLETGSVPTSYISTPATFTSRASTATFYNSAGTIITAGSGVARNPAFLPDSSGVFRNVGLLLENSATNLIPYSEYFTGWSFTSALGTTRFTLIPNVYVSPNNTITAEFIRETTANGPGYYQRTLSLTAGSNFSISCYVYGVGNYASNTTRRVILGLFETSSGTSVDGYTVAFNLFSSTVTSSRLGTPIWAGGTGTSAVFTQTGSRITNVGNGWRRIEIFGKCSVNNPIIIFTTLNRELGTGDNDGGGTFTMTGDGSSGIAVWGFQAETSAVPTSYIPTPATFTSRSSTATYFDSNGILRTAGVNVARSDAYLPDTNEVYRPAGLLLEGAATNLARNSEAFNSWASNGGGIGVSVNQSVALDRTTTADHLFQTSATGASRWIGSVSRTVTGGTPYTISCWVRRVSGSDAQPSIRMGFINSGQYGASITSQITSSWKRFSVTLTPSVDVGTWIGFDIGWNQDGAANNNVYAVWGFQVETGTIATSYIPVTSADVTRAADLSSSTTQTRAADVSSSSAVTRAADVSSSPTVTRAADSASMTGTNFNSWYNPSGGTLLSLREGNSSVLTTSSLTLNSTYTKTSTISNLLYYPTALSYNAIERMNGSVPFITNGLRIYLDAGAKNSYVGSGTSWTDLSGNGNNGTLVNGPTYNNLNEGSIVFDGINDHVNFSSNPSLTNELTVEVWVKLIPTTPNLTGWICGREQSYRLIYSSGSFIWVCATVNNAWYTEGTTVAASMLLNSSKIYHVVGTYNGLNIKIYVDGILINTGTSISGNILNTSTYYLFRSDAVNVDYGKGNLYLHRLYNRALSESEIKQNYNATKYRFAA